MDKFDTLLVANRGEIACRIIRSARAQGLRTVALYSDADAAAPHVALADQAVHIGASPAAQSYLNVEAILAAARATGASAIHPGYGFLSENADFARAVQTAGLIFVGPPPEAIEVMGDKAIAKAHMIAADVPCVPGYQGDDQTDAALIAAAQKIGTPIMVKAAAGGGGKGMRLVSDMADLPEALSLARSEAMASFGADHLILEKAVQNARHVEIQIFADSHGTTLHLGERDCSVQRRHQKVIEEAPCPVMTDTLRAAMGAAAVAAARSVGYVGAGTVEFLLTDSGEFYFLEMNTRLQVEHPVTEMITGLDLVALQLSVAQGDALPITQDDVTLTGHAIEVRLYAEDPANDFLPATGTIARWQPADDIRVDAGITTTSEISPYYDPMLAKLIAYGATRDIARRKLIAALQDTAILGVTTNIGFLADILASPEFAAGQATTTFLDQNLPPTTAPSTQTQALAAALLLHSEMSDAQTASLSVDDALLGFASDGGLPVPLDLALNDTPFALTVHGTGTDAMQVTGDGWSHKITLQDNANATTIDGLRHAHHFAPDGSGGLYLQCGGTHLHVTRHHPWATTQNSASSDRVTAPMPGLVVAIKVAVDDSVTKGQTLAVLEAMKMQHQLVAGQDGIVAEIHAEVGQQLASAALILTLKDPQ